MRKIVLSIIGVFIIVASVYGAMLIVKSKNRTRPRPAKVVKTVFVDTVQNQVVPIVVPANGNLVAKQRFELFSEVQGVFKSSGQMCTDLKQNTCFFTEQSDQKKPGTSSDRKIINTEPFLTIKKRI